MQEKQDKIALQLTKSTCGEVVSKEMNVIHTPEKKTRSRN
jgi:hypothetical protein